MIALRGGNTKDPTFPYNVDSKKALEAKAKSPIIRRPLEVS